MDSNLLAVVMQGMTVRRVNGIDPIEAEVMMYEQCCRLIEENARLIRLRTRAAIASEFPEEVAEETDR